MSAQTVRELAPLTVGCLLLVGASWAWAHRLDPAVVLSLLTACGVLAGTSAAARRFLRV